MGSNVSKIAIMAVLGVGFLAWADASHASDDYGRRGHPSFRPAEEVVSGTYQCTGSVYTDEQEPQISAAAWFNATSDLAMDYYGSGKTTRDVPADLDAMATICEAHVDEVFSMVPGSCVLGPVVSEGGEFGNGANVGSSFQFSCQGTRNAMIGVIGGFSRAPLIVSLP